MAASLKGPWRILRGFLFVVYIGGTELLIQMPSIFFLMGKIDVIVPMFN